MSNDTVDKIVIAARALRPYPAADVGIGGDAVVGTLGLPPVTNRNKKVTLLEEGFDLYGTVRERTMATVTRGDLAAETLSDTLSWAPIAAVAGTFMGHVESNATFAGQISVLYHFQDIIVVTGSLGGRLWSIDGFGSIDVGIKALRMNFPSGGKYGLTDAGFDGWNTIVPTVNVFAPSWRNLLSNVRWNYQDGSSGVAAWPPAWDQGTPSGLASVASGVTSISRQTSGNGSYYFVPGAASVVREQQIPLGYFNFAWNDPKRPTNWLGRGLTLIAAGYFRNLVLDTNDTAQMDVIARDENLTSLGSASTGAFASPTTAWQYREIALLAAPSGTQAVGVKLTFSEVAGSGTANADTSATELRLFVGQFAANTSTLLTNPSFETGTTASWTVDAGGFVVATTNASPSANYVQGGAFATNTIHQDYALPVGYEYGTAILRCWRMQTLANDAGEVKVQVLDSLGAVLATATTGSETLSSLNIWYSRLVYVQTVDGAAKIRVTFTALRSLGAGNSGACLDEANLMFAKDLDAAYKLALTFDTPTVQQVASTWQDYHRAYPTRTIPDVVFSGNAPGQDAATEWSDGIDHGSSAMTGQFGGGVMSIPAYHFTRIASPSQIVVRPAGAATLGSASTVGAYTIAGSFTALTFFRVDEPGFASFCGLLGRMNASRGWGLNITAAGQLEALLRGTGGTSKTVATGRVIAEGGLHLAAIVYDAVAQTLTVYDEGGGVSVSTAAGLNDFASLSTDTDCYFRIGTDAPDHDSLPGQIGPIYLWGSALSSADIAAHWNYAKDPTGKITTYTRTAAAIMRLGNDASGNAQACVVASNQVALPYNPTLAVDGGTGIGLAIGKSATNLIPDVNFAGANWVKDAATVLTQSTTDPTGRPRGVQVAGDATDGLYVQNVTLAASPATVPLVFYAKSVSGSTTLNVELRTSTGTLVSTQAVTLTTLWQRFAITLTGWAGATATARIRFVPGATATFVLGGVVCALQGTDFPALLPLPASTHGDYNATVSTTLPKQFVYEGEIIATGVGMIDSPTTAAATLVQASDGTAANLRELQVISGSTGFRCVHKDSSGVQILATSGYSTYSSRVWQARARWALCGMLDNVSPQDFSAVAWTDDTHSTPTVVTGRTTAWTITAVSLTTLKLGAGTAAPSDVVLRSVTARAREQKLP